MGQCNCAPSGRVAARVRDWRLAYGLACLQFFLAGFLLAASAPILPQLAIEWRLGPAQLGLLGSALFYAYAAVQIPAGVLADAFGSRRVLILSALLAALGAAGFGAAPSFGAAVVTRLVVGAGTGLVYTAGVRLIAELASRQPVEGGRFVALYGPFVAMNYLGSALASIPLLVMVDLVGWRLPLAGTAAVAAALAAATWALPSPAERDGRRRGTRLRAGMAAWSAERTIWAYTTLRFLYGSFAGMQALWAVPLLLVTFQASREVVGVVLLAMSLGQIIGPPLAAWLAVRSHQSQRVVMGGAIAYAVISLALVGMIRVQLGPGFLTVVFFMLSVAQSLTLIGYGLVTARVAPDLQGTMAGLVNLGPFLGSALFQVIAGFLVQGQVSASGTNLVAEANYAVVLLLLMIVAIVAIPLTRLLTERT